MFVRFFEAIENEQKADIDVVDAVLFTLYHMLGVTSRRTEAFFVKNIEYSVIIFLFLNNVKEL